MTTFVVVGSGKMAAGVLRILSETPDARVLFCLGDARSETNQSRFASACAKQSVAYFEVPTLKNNMAELDRVTSASPDFIISANNFLIFPKEWLSVAKYGIVNFHNGPLPRYGGLNACSWAILNNESTHGVTWHLVDQGIDSGPILSQHSFAVQQNVIAIELIGKCINLGLTAFEALVGRLIEKNLEPLPQDLTTRLYYKKSDRPYSGKFPWWESRTRVDAFVRALTFRPFGNLFFRPEINVGDQRLFIDQLDLMIEPATRAAGHLELSENDDLIVSFDGGKVRLSGLYTESGARVELRNDSQLEKLWQL